MINSSQKYETLLEVFFKKKIQVRTVEAGVSNAAEGDPPQYLHKYPHKLYPRLPPGAPGAP